MFFFFFSLYTSDATNLLTKPDTIMHHVFISIIFRLTCLAPIDSNIFSSWILNCWTLFINTQGYKKTKRDTLRVILWSFFMYHVQCNKCFFSTEIQHRQNWLKKHGRNWQETPPPKTYNLLFVNIRRKILGQHGTVLQKNFGNCL